MMDTNELLERPTFVLAVLCGLTLLTWGIFEIGLVGPTSVSIGVLAIGAFKAHWVYLYFVELANTPAKFRVAFTGWGWFCAVAILGSMVVL